MSTPPQPKQIGAQEARESKPALLIVDDDPLITDTLAFALGTDYTVYACDSRPHAIELLRQLDAPPPLALVDLGLPPAPHATGRVSIVAASRRRPRRSRTCGASTSRCPRRPQTTKQSSTCSIR